MAVTTQASFETGHTDQVHDCQLDYYGRRLATCSSDRQVKIFEVAGGSHTNLASLVGHEGPVWQVSWSHPQQGSLLATCGFDSKVIIWQETRANMWEKINEAPPGTHTGSVNAVSWAPPELGTMLAAASSDGSISITYLANGQWHVDLIPSAHPPGALSVSWAGVQPYGNLLGAQGDDPPSMALASGGCDNKVKMWRYDESDSAWKAEGPPLEGHVDWVRAVAYAPSVGLGGRKVASCGQDGRVLVLSADASGSFQAALVSDYGVKNPLWSVSWSAMGNILAVADSNQEVRLWKEEADSSWAEMGSLDSSH